MSEADPDEVQLSCQPLQSFSDLKPEISLILKLVIFRYGILASSTSPGGKLVNLKLVDSKGTGYKQKRKPIYCTGRQD